MLASEHSWHWCRASHLVWQSWGISFTLCIELNSTVFAHWVYRYQFTHSLFPSLGKLRAIWVNVSTGWQCDVAWVDATQGCHGYALLDSAAAHGWLYQPLRQLPHVHLLMSSIAISLHTALLCELSGHLRRGQL